MAKWTLPTATATLPRSAPTTGTLDVHFLERPNARRVQLDLFYDYRTNVALYPAWQAFLRERQPETLILWGQNDVFLGLPARPAKGGAHPARYGSLRGRGQARRDRRGHRP